MSDEERRMPVQIRFLPPANPEEKSEVRSSRVPRWLMVLAAVVPAVVIIVIVYGYLDMPGSGWIGVADKKFWDYLDLLIVPAAIAIGVAVITWIQSERQRQADRVQDERERKAEEDRKEREREAQTAQRKRELEVENQRAQDQALQAYFNQMSQLLLDKDSPLRQSEDGSEGRVLARARTLTVLKRLDGSRKGNVVQFLYESELITKDGVIVDLTGANLSDAILSEVYLTSLAAAVPGVPGVDVQNVANLRGADLSGTNLRGANLRLADLRETDLSRTNLIEADLSWADLRGADLSGASLRGAVLIQVNLLGTNLTKVDLTGATMPNGQEYKVWLKDKEGRGEDGENSGPS